MELQRNLQGVAKSANLCRLRLGFAMFWPVNIMGMDVYGCALKKYLQYSGPMPGDKSMVIKL